MGETTRDTDDLAASAISFRVVVAEPGKKGWAVKYGPYQSWTIAAFDCGIAIGFFRGRKVPSDWLRIEWSVGGKVIDTPSVLADALGDSFE
jgi:hypothetical protein